MSRIHSGPIPLAIAIAIAIAMIAASGLTVAFAQYPTPIGNLTLTPSADQAEPDSDVEVEARLVSGGGAGSEEECTAEIASQPGEGASVEPEEFTTSDTGDATLIVHVGSEPGDVELTVECGGPSANVVLTVRPAPDGAGGSVDETGDADSGSDSNLLLWILLALAAVFGAGAVGAFVYRRRAAGP